MSRTKTMQVTFSDATRVGDFAPQLMLATQGKGVTDVDIKAMPGFPGTYLVSWTPALWAVTGTVKMMSDAAIALGATPQPRGQERAG